MFLASLEILKQLQHFDSGQDEPNSDQFFHRDSARLKTLDDSNNIETDNNNEQSQNDDIDEARYNLATRIMSNGVEVIIASDKTKTPTDHKVPDISSSQLQNNKPTTLAASTIKNQMMILLFPSSLTADNGFVTNGSLQQLNYNLPFHTNHFITKTCLTTYTYRTTYVQDGRTTVESREKVISNIATEERNYPKITPTQTIGVTLTKTPELAVGIFPTTYSYFNTFKDNSDKLLVMTSEYTVVNTITGPNDYVAYLQPTAKATPALNTNTYYDEITLSEKIKSNMHTVKRNLTQVVVTKSYTPAHSTSVLTSYYAYDDDGSSEESNVNINKLKASLTSNEGVIAEENLNKDKTKLPDDIHIYATKTFLTTFTYYTTTVINSYLSDSRRTELDIKPLSTVFNYYTRVIENVITDSVPATLLPQDLLAKMKMELRKQKPNQRRRVIVTTATLKDGQTVKISAMKMYKANLASDTFSLSQSQPVVDPLNDLQVATEDHYLSQEEYDEANDDYQLQGPSNSSGIPAAIDNFKRPGNQGGVEGNNKLASLSSEHILSIVEAPNKQTLPPVITNDKPSTSAANQLIQRLTALKPMFNAMADLLQNNFGVTRDTIKPIKNIESKQAPNKKIHSSATNVTAADIKHPIYIPVQKSPIKHNPYESSNNTEFIPQSLHIKPPLVVNDEENFELDNKQKVVKGKRTTHIIPLRTLTAPRQEQPLHNGGIYIRPGEVITANSDVIIGKPNGIQYAHIPNHAHLKNTSSKAHALDNRQFEVTYYHNKVQHSYKKKLPVAVTSITHKPQHIPLANSGNTHNNLIPQPTFGLKPPSEEYFNKNILKPPPPLPTTIHSSIPIHSQPGLSLMLSAPDKPAKTRNKQQATTNGNLSAASTASLQIYSPPPPAPPPPRATQTLHRFNNHFKHSNEILEIQQIPQVFNAAFTASSSKSSNINRQPQKYAYSSSSFSSSSSSNNNNNQTNIDTKYENNINSLKVQNAREPQTLSPYIQMQPAKNFQHLAKDAVSSEYYPKFASSVNWKNNRESPIRTSTPLSHINGEQKMNSESEIALIGSSLVWNLQHSRPPQLVNQFPAHIKKEGGPRRPTAAVSSPNLADMHIFFKSFPSTPKLKFSYNPSSNAVLNKEKITSNESLTKNHQNVSLDKHIFSHTVDVNVPPLTFNKEDNDYPQQAAAAVRGQIPPATVKELKTQSENSYKYMPLITIPANEQQVQVSLTPINSISSLSLPFEVQNEPAWNAKAADNDNNNNTVRKISLMSDNYKSFVNEQDQKTFETSNIVNIKSRPKPESKRQQLFGYSRLNNNKLQMLATTKPINPGVNETQEKNSKTEQHFRSTLKPNRRHQQVKVSDEPSFRTTAQPIAPSLTDSKYPSLRLNQPQSLQNELKIVTPQPHLTKPNKSDWLGLPKHSLEKENKQTFPSRAQQVPINASASKEQTRATRVSLQKTKSFAKIINETLATTKSTKTSKNPATVSEPTPKDINDIMNSEKKGDEQMQVGQLVTYGEPFRKSNYSYRDQNGEAITTSDNYTKTVPVIVAPGEPFKTVNANVKITTVKLEQPTKKQIESSLAPYHTTKVFVNTATPGTPLDSAAKPLKVDPNTSTLKTNTATTETPRPSPAGIATSGNATTKEVLADYSANTTHANEKIYIKVQNAIEPDETLRAQNIVTLNNIMVTKSHSNFSLENNEQIQSAPIQNTSRKYVEGFGLYKLQPSETYNNRKLATTRTLPIAAPILTFITTTTTTTTIKRIILPTKYITNKRVYTVTTTTSAPAAASAPLPPLLPSTNLQSTHFLSTTETTTEVTTLYLTHTQINRIVDTVTSVKTIEPITITATTTLKPFATESHLKELSSVKPHLLKLPSQEDQFSTTESHTFSAKQNLTYLPYPSVEIVSTNITQESGLSSDENSIFIIMTNNKNKKNKISSHESTPPVGTTVQELTDDENSIGQIDEANEVMIEYDNGISFDDVPIRDEAPEEIVNGKSVSSTAFFNNVASAKEMPSDGHVILGGVLIATPPKYSTKQLNTNETANVSCQPKCKASRNEQCGLIDNQWSCFCRPGFARMFPDRPCKPTYTYGLLMHAERIGNYPLKYNDVLKNNKTDHYTQLSQLVTNALDRMIMQSDFRDAYHGVEVTQYSDNHKNYNGILINVLLKLSDNSNEKRLEEVLKKNLRLSNYSIGGTDLYTNKAGVDALAIKDFNECKSRQLHDCSKNAHCFNLPGTYTCSCEEGYADLSDNPIYPGRICSSEEIGCEMCHYHGKCSTLVANSNDRNYCECFPWYAGSKCQVNLKILLIVLLGIGTLLFILLLFCILITCTKRRNHLQHTALTPSTMTSSSEVLQKNSRLAANMVITSVGLRSSLRGINLRNNKRQKSINIDKRSMIRDSSSETSQNSLPYVLKNRGSIEGSCNKKKTCLFKHSKKYRSCNAQGGTKEQQYSVSIPSNSQVENQSNLNTVTMTSSSFKGHNQQQTEQQNLLGNANDYEGHYCEQSDRSLTVMIPRAKYHSSLLSQKQLMHHQLTMERVYKTEKPEKKFNNNDQNAEVSRNYKRNFSMTRDMTGEENCTEVPSNPGALISAGFEVSAIVRDNTTLVTSGEQQNEVTQFDSILPNYTIITTSDPATSLDSNSGQKHLVHEERQQYTANKKFSPNEPDYNLYKCEKDLIETMDEWLGNVKFNELSAEARSFDETTIRASTKPLRLSADGTQTQQLHDEVNTMAERDLDSTFLLPHTHLYKPERQESELSGFDSC